VQVTAWPLTGRTPVTLDPARSERIPPGGSSGMGLPAADDGRATGLPLLAPETGALHPRGRASSRRSFLMA
jgi:hypothetical protein